MPSLQNHVKYSLKLSRHIFLKRYNFYSTSTVGKIDRVLIANRGEIACRVIRTAKRLGIESVVAVYSDPDSNAQHVRMCNGPGDLAFRIGEAPSLKSYLRAEKIIEVAKQANVQAIHPGYGFLSENAAFAEACADAGIKFMGPSADAIRAMGQKNRAKQIMIDANVPVLLGYNGADQDPELLLEEAKKIGFPVMIKPVYGGGGKGMRVSNSVDDFMECLESAKSESTKSFGNAEMILERYIADPRHVEVQIFGDMHGNYVHLWERDCSIQRRHQKIIEEAPAPGLDDETRQRLGNTAVNAARAVQYEGAGTVEFIYDRETADFYFMEMNTRLQVEHPVTEAITGVDLVEWQFKVAEGKPLPIVNQSDIKMNGHALEARIYAEEIDKTTFNFMPSAGVLEYLRFPETRSMTDDSDSMAPYTRVDSGVQEGDCVSVHYDPMIAKIVGWAPSRTEAIKQLDKALSETHIGGLQNNIKFVKACLAQPQFVSGDVATDFIEKNKEHLVTSDHFAPKPTNCAIVEGAVAEILLKTFTSNPSVNGPFNTPDFFRVNHFAKRKVILDHSKKTPELTAQVTILGDSHYLVEPANGTAQAVKVSNVTRNVSTVNACPVVSFSLESDGRKWQCEAVQLKDSVLVHSGNVTREWDIPADVASSALDDSLLSSGESAKKEARSPIPGVVEKIFIQIGDKVAKTQALATMTAMKMEFVIRAPRDVVISSVEVEAGQTVGKNAVLVRFAENAEEQP